MVSLCVLLSNIVVAACRTFESFQLVSKLEPSPFVTSLQDSGLHYDIAAGTDLGGIHHFGFIFQLFSSWIITGYQPVPPHFWHLRFCMACALFGGSLAVLLLVQAMWGSPSSTMTCMQPNESGKSPVKLILVTIFFKEFGEIHVIDTAK